MDSVINETLRFYPPVTDFVSRVAQVDYYYKGIVIPRDCCIDVAVPQLHRDPSFWTEPDKFIPDRFLKDKSLTSSIYFQPFGFGPRNCIGLRFALMEAKMCMARLLKSYKLLAGPRTEIGDIEIKYKPISMTPKKGVFVRVVKV
jgi:cytochrome P450